MKKILYLIPLLLMATACDWFVFDNMDGYDATITGKFIDAKTNEPVLFGVPDNYGFTIYEQEGSFTPAKGTFTPTSQTWYAKTNGTYTNNLVFSGNYKIDTKTNNFYPFAEEFKIQKGANTHDFTVTPYARIKDVKFSYDSATKEIVAKFKVEHGDASKTNGINAYLLIAQDRFVGKNHNNATDATAKISNAKPGEEIELRVNTTHANNSEFKYTQPHYLRIGAMAAYGAVKDAYDEETVDWGAWGALGYAGYPNPPAEVMVTVHHDAEFTPNGTVNPNAQYNYSNVWKVDQTFSTFTEVTDWD